jgi:hypothetical protein
VRLEFELLKIFDGLALPAPIDVYENGFHVFSDCGQVLCG